METRLESVEISTKTTAEHSIRCAEKWDQHDRVEARQLTLTTGVSAIAGAKQAALIAALVSVAIAVMNLIF